MRASKGAEAEENSSTTISNIKLYNLLRDSLKSLLSSVSCTQAFRTGRSQYQLFTDAIDIFIDERRRETRNGILCNI